MENINLVIGIIAIIVFVVFCCCVGLFLCACVIAKGLELDDALAMLYGLCHKYEGETKECGWIIKSYEEVEDEE